MTSTPDPSKPDPSKPEAGRGEPEKAGWLARKRARPGAGEAVKAEPAPPPPRKKRKTGITAMFSGLMTATVFLLVAVFAGVPIANSPSPARCRPTRS
jgi:hypothetical protein